MHAGRLAPGSGWRELAGARVIAEQHGGEIKLHSGEGQGTKGTLILPLDAA